MPDRLTIPGVNPAIAPPSRLDGLRELATPFDLLHLAARWWTLPSTPDGRGVTVMLIPGFGASDHSLFALHGYLRRRGYETLEWGLGRNGGNVPDLMPRVVERVRGIARARGRRVALVGWSLGGYLAREAARDEPDAVRHVVTVGSPVVGGPKYTAVAPYYLRRGVDLDGIEAAVADRYRVPLRVPVTAIYSRNDGVVAWRACIDQWSPQVEHVRVTATHLGLGWSPDVLQIVADRLKPSTPSPAAEA